MWKGPEGAEGVEMGKAEGMIEGTWNGEVWIGKQQWREKVVRDLCCVDSLPIFDFKWKILRSNMTSYFHSYHLHNKKNVGLHLTI